MVARRLKLGPEGSPLLLLDRTEQLAEAIKRTGQLVRP